MKIETLQHAFNIFYGLTERQRANYYLIERYWDKISPRLKSVHADLEVVAREQLLETMSGIIYKTNPFLALFKDAPSFSGKYLPVPITFGPTHG